MEGIPQWRINERALCEALIEDPHKTWRVVDLAQLSGLEYEKTEEVLREFAQLGALIFMDPRVPPLPNYSRTGQPYSPGVRQVRLIGEGAAVIRNALDAGRSHGVIGTFLWEGWDNAVAVWQAKRREKAWRRSRG